jgi:hypothetical protein
LSNDFASSLVSRQFSIPTEPESPRATPPVTAPEDNTSGMGVAPPRAFGGGPASSNSYVPPESAGTLIDSLRSPSGRTVDPFTAKPGDRVWVGGVETSVAAAMTMGLLTRNPHTGALMETKAGAVTSPRGSAPANSGPSYDERHPAHNVPLDRASASFLATMTDRVPGTDLASAANDLVINGKVDGFMVQRMASQLGVEPDDLSARIEAFSQGVKNQATRCFQQCGVQDVEELLTWAKAAKPDLLREATKRQIAGDLAGITRLATLYFENLADINPKKVLEAKFGSGIEARLVNRKVVLSVPGMGEVEYRSAIRAGIIKAGW